MKYLAVLLATIVAVAIVGVALRPSSAQAAGTCSDSVSWQGISGTINQDTCGTDITEIAFCGADDIQSNSPSQVGDVFGFGDNWLPFATACDSGVVVYLDFLERGTLEHVGSYIDVTGSYTGATSATWTAR